MKHSKFQTSAPGFTLIELMVTLAIIGVLAVIAIPQYNRFIQDTERKMVNGALKAFALAMDRHYSENNYSYTGAAGTQASPADTGTPWIFPAQAPLDSNNKTYSLTIQSATGSTFILRATPINAAEAAQNGYYQIDNTGEITHGIPAPQTTT